MFDLVSTSHNNAQTVECLPKTSLEIILHKPHFNEFHIEPPYNIIIHKRLDLSTNWKFKNRKDQVFLFFFFIDVWLKITINHFAISRSKICKLYFYQDSTITFFIDKSVNLVTFTSCVCLFYVKRYNGTLKYKELGNQNDPIKIFKNAFKRERITSKRLQWGIVF